MNKMYSQLFDMKGGAGWCKYCHQFIGNVSFHESNMCEKNPDSWENKSKKEKDK